MKEGCVFCKLANGHIPVNIVLNGEHSVMIADQKPMAPVHMLVISKDHYGDVGDLLPSEYATVLADMFTLIDDYVCQHDHANKGYRLVINTGKDAGQTVKHFHIHLLGGAPLMNGFGAPEPDGHQDVFK